MYNPKKVSVSVGGGFGDAFQVYFSNPISHCQDSSFPTSHHVGSLWFRRLRDFKKQNPDVEIAFIPATHTIKPVLELFETNPYIDKIFNEGYKVPNDDECRLFYIGKDEYNGKPSCYDSEMEYNPIHWFYNYEDYEPDDPDLFLTKDDIEIVNTYDYEYFTFHPFARIDYREVMPLNRYCELSNMLPKQSLFLGSEISKFNARVSIQLILNSIGFVGTHSSLWLVAIYTGVEYNIPTVCFIPNHKHFEDIKGDPTTWGFTQTFNKTFTFSNKEEVNLFDMTEVVDWLMT
jgi:hypothetical protein